MKNKEEILERIARLVAFNNRWDGDYRFRSRNRTRIKELNWMLGSGEDLDENVYPLTTSLNREDNIE